MTPIPKTFFITGLGRSGTAFLADALGRTSQYRVVHEWKVPRTPFRDGRLSRFPLWRFYLSRHPFSRLRPGYGEVNSHLRRTLHPTREGPEAYVERRGVILREPRDVIASAMNRSGRTEGDFGPLCDHILRDLAHLYRLLDHPTLHYERFSFERFTNDPEGVREIAAWSGITDLDVSAVAVTTKVNVNKTAWFPRWDSWTGAQRDAFYKAAVHHGLGHVVDAPDLLDAR